MKIESPKTGAAARAGTGAIKVAVTARDGAVMLMLSNPVRWLGMKPDMALELAENLKKGVLLARRQMGKGKTQGGSCGS